jgi:hypothetical protein
MKSLVWILFAILLLSVPSCKEAINVAAEEEAIIAVIQDEKDGYIQMDMEQWSRNVLQDQSYTWMAASSQQYIFNRGYTAQADQIREWWNQREPGVTVPKLEFNVLDIKVFSEAAWALIELQDRIELFFLEKSEDRWVISIQSIIGTASYQKKGYIPAPILRKCSIPNSCGSTRMT